MFKEFYDLEQYKKEIFDEVFEKYYQSNYFGNINKIIIKEQQKKWFGIFNQILLEKNINDVFYILKKKDNKIAREWFSRISNDNIKNKSEKLVKHSIINFFEMR